jgi:hypothetical protein
MRRSVIAGFLAVLSVSGCASMKVAPPGGTTSGNEGQRAAQVPAPPGAASPIPPPASAPLSKAESSTADGSDRSSAPPQAPGAAAEEPPPPRPSSPGTPSTSGTPATPAKAKSSADTRPVKQTGAAARAVPAAAPAATPSAPPTLNLADLEQRLRETRAIGVFSKLSLKNQVDDLLNAFRDLYRGPNKHPTPELRQRYEQLLLKVLTLLQDGDPPLAAAIASSREAIWNILADPEKFAKI